MSDQLQALRNDLAFMKAVVEDKTNLCAEFGAQLLIPALIYGILTISIWAVLIGAISLPAWWLRWSGFLGAAIHIAISFLLRRSNPTAWGPHERTFVAAWQTMGWMLPTTLFALFLARTRVDAPFLLLWPPIALMLFGGSWMMVGVLRKNKPYQWLAGGCFLTALLCALLISNPLQWLAFGIGTMLWIGAPGAVILLRARTRDQGRVLP